MESIGMARLIYPKQGAGEKGLVPEEKRSGM
jgi:hypothetical protein